MLASKLSASEFNRLVDQVFYPLRVATTEQLQRCHLQMQILLVQAQIETLDRGKPDADTVKAAELMITIAGEEPESHAGGDHGS